MGWDVGYAEVAGWLGGSEPEMIGGLPQALGFLGFVRYIIWFVVLARSPRSARFHAPQERGHSLAARERGPNPTQPQATQANPTHPRPANFGNLISAQSKGMRSL